jgi:hypothetical protein
MTVTLMSAAPPSSGTIVMSARPLSSVVTLALSPSAEIVPLVKLKFQQCPDTRTPSPVSRTNEASKNSGRYRPAIAASRPRGYTVSEEPSAVPHNCTSVLAARLEPEDFSSQFRHDFDGFRWPGKTGSQDLEKIPTGRSYAGNPLRAL